ncbi:MAG: benzoate-CoA ligase family protein [Gammaproteobacteria bacterium]|nr:benzoate-CoA ligase family protein [Gammaproteobacteria bacterium]NIR85650.1 benzoate-CoA ligase family protein [Gammaproteobacteria bacterium]NIR90138.1 benzoate-CoA ligase family protein [Gammaproteobacteria bacterium]NIU06784.1 benzoate-CoA ligase family protein [Gammaproteobacteria bacterium]NIV53717.1 benzoate-CoA ligase family protein [Gammaproteobacteria bacterium]
MNEIVDRVPDTAPGAAEIGFSVPDRYNAGDILYHNLHAGRRNKIAVLSPLGNRTYGQLCDAASRLGNALRSLGLEPGDRVLLFLNDTAAYACAFFGAVRAGFVPTLINTQSPKDLIRFYLEDSGARAVVVDADYAPLFDEACMRGTSAQTAVVCNGAGEPRGASRIEHADSWLAGFEPILEAAATGRDDVAFLMYSSGSTGRPKGVVHLQHDMLYTARAFAQHVLAIREGDICFSVPKIFFAYGFGNSVTFPCWAGASSALYPGRPVPEAVFDCIERFRPTLFFGLPTLYRTLLASERGRAADLSSVRLFISAGEVLSAEIFNAWKERFGAEIVDGLGSTEMLQTYLSNTPERNRPGSSGRRVPGYEVRLANEAGEPVAAGEEGVLWARGHSSAPCYWNRPEKTAETMRDGWIWTGDRFVQEEDGFFFYRGRQDDLIKVSGQWVHPLEVELCLADHHAVRECAVQGVELPDRRMALRAFVVLNQEIPARPEIVKALQDHVKRSLLPYKYPRIVEFLDALPKTGTGKIDRKALRRRPIHGTAY